MLECFNINFSTNICLDGKFQYLKSNMEDIFTNKYCLVWLIFRFNLHCCLTVSWMIHIRFVFTFCSKYKKGSVLQLDSSSGGHENLEKREWISPISNWKAVTCPVSRIHFSYIFPIFYIFIFSHFITLYITYVVLFQRIPLWYSDMFKICSMTFVYKQVSIQK